MNTEGDPQHNISSTGESNGDEIPVKTKEEMDKEISSFLEALALHPTGNPDRAQSLFNLAQAFMDRHTEPGSEGDLENAISLFQEGLGLRPPGHPDRLLSLKSLANALNVRYEKTDRMEDLKSAISMHYEMLTLRPKGHPDQLPVLDCLVTLLIRKHSKTRAMEDLEASISSQRELLALHPPDHPKRYISLYNLAVLLQTQYHGSERLEDINIAISFYHDVLARQTPEDIRKMSLDNLADGLEQRYKLFDDIEDINKAISLRREALAFHKPTHPEYFDSLGNLSDTLDTRYQKSKNMEDLDSCILVERELLALNPPGHPNRSASLNNLAISLIDRYREKKEVEDLQSAISFFLEALALRPPGNDCRETSLDNLADGLEERYKLFDDIEDINQAIFLRREALALHEPTHPEYLDSLGNLSKTLSVRYQKSEKMEDLDSCILVERELLALNPPGHPNRSASLNNLAISLIDRYREKKEVEDLQSAISFFLEALTLRPPGNDCRETSLDNLADGLEERYTLFDDIEDINQAIFLRREALALHEPTHPDYLDSLGKLSDTLDTRYRKSEKVEDLDSCILVERELLALNPPGHSNRSTSLNNLAIALMERYRAKKEVEDLQSVISFSLEALALRPPGNDCHETSLDNLANGLEERYKLFDDIEDINQAISLRREALALHEPTHPEYLDSLGNLSKTLSVRYQKSDKLEDLDSYISVERELLALKPPGNFNQTIHSTSLMYLTTGLLRRYEKLSREDDLREAFDCFDQIACHDVPLSPFNFKNRFFNAINWVRSARYYQHESILRAYKALLNLVDCSLLVHRRFEGQYKFLFSEQEGVPYSVASDAASAAIEAGNLELAVEFLEQGRTMIWSKISAYKHPLDRLRQVQGCEELADRLETLNAELLTLSSIGESDSSVQGIHELGAQMTRNKALSEEWKGLVERVREIDGFVDFLRPPSFRALQAAAAEGPVIMVNVSEYRSDALVLYRENPPVLINLPGVSPADLREQTAVPYSELPNVLRYLWHRIVSPVVRCLMTFGVQQHSRIWWCPTAELRYLPLHAAGPYLRDSLNLSDTYVCSYTPTLSSLIMARSGLTQPLTSPELLIVAQPDQFLTVGILEEEIKIIIQQCRSKVLLDAGATREAVIQCLTAHPWAHFSCHHEPCGLNTTPLQNSFKLHDGHLSFLDLIRMKVRNAEFAFIGDSDETFPWMPDQNINLSTALQFCGFRSVVGTLWGVQEEHKLGISASFYKYMFRNPEQVDFRDSAHALRQTMLAMRNAELHPQYWAVMVHIGA